MRRQAISIRESPTRPDGFNATLSFDGQGEYPIAVGDPFSAEEEQRLEWYFEQHMRFPFTDHVQAQEAAASVTAYGERLFEQAFGDRQVFADYKAALQAGVGQLSFEIAMIASPYAPIALLDSRLHSQRKAPSEAGLSLAASEACRYFHHLDEPGSYAYCFRYRLK